MNNPNIDEVRAALAEEYGHDRERILDRARSKQAGLEAAVSAPQTSDESLQTGCKPDGTKPRPSGPGPGRPPESAA